MNSTLLTQLFIDSDHIFNGSSSTTVSTFTESTTDADFILTPFALMVKQNHEKHHTHHHKQHHNEEVSPVTLSNEWSRMARLILLSCLSVVGSVGNVFMISSVMIEDQLKKAGNAFVVNVALADLLVTSILIPASIIVILANDKETYNVCKFQWFLAAYAFLVTVLSLVVSIKILNLITNINIKILYLKFYNEIFYK